VDKEPRRSSTDLAETPAWDPWSETQLVIAKRPEAKALSREPDVPQAALWAIGAVALLVVLLALRAIVRRIRSRRAARRERVLVAEPRREPEAVATTTPRWRERDDYR
jgi:hypothetical protein